MDKVILLVSVGLLLLSFSPMLIILILETTDMRQNPKRLEQVQSECDEIVNQLV